MRLPGDIDGRRFLKAMARWGWSVVRQRGSHRILVHPGHARAIVVAFHRRISRRSVRDALRQADIEEVEFQQTL